MKIKNAFLHFKKICIHKYWVGKYCFRMGLYWQGIAHDLSKFSPVEFFESVKYYQGTRSPIDACKEANGYSMGWFHHRGRNPHHYEYWQDNFDKGGEPVLMPKKYAIEMLCDYLGAARAYTSENFTMTSEWNWWLNKKSKGIAMHPNTIKFIDICLESAKDFGEDCLTKENVENFYKISLK